MAVSEKRAVGSTRADKDSLLDLTSDGDNSMSSPVIKQTAQSTQDLLADIFGSSAPSGAAPVAPANRVDDIMSLFGGGGGVTAPVIAQQPRPASMTEDFFGSSSISAPPQPASYTAFTSSVSGLALTFTPAKDAAKPNVVNITTTFSTSMSTSGPITGINFQAAVPKTMKLQLQAISDADLRPGQTQTQLMRILVPPGAAIRLRLRLSYTYNGQQQQEQAEYAFPAGAV